jgi:hypothetical protein
LHRRGERLSTRRRRGPSGYIEFLDAISDPSHEEHESMLEWIGGSFDPKAFDIAEVNERLAEFKL